MEDLGTRMKGYEAVSKEYLMKKTPVVCRIDGRAFHTFTRGFVRPYDGIMADAMHRTMLDLCKSIPNTVMGYTQSDEITLVLCDYDTINKSPWFDYNVQKMTSIIASMATIRFNRFFAENVKEYETETEEKTLFHYKKVLWSAEFDVRVFNLPVNEVANNLYWRQLDATRNSIESLGRAYYSHKELLNKNCSDIQDMLMKKGINWNNLETWKKRGCCAVKEYDDEKERYKWKLDLEIPVFSKNWDYINQKITFET